MDRAPGLSVRLKLTLSYAGFLMLAGALLLGRRVAVPPAIRPQRRDRHRPQHGTSVHGIARPWRISCAISLRAAAIWWRSCWCSVSWEGGFSPAGCSPP